MSPPAVTVECAACGAAAPQMPGVPPSVLVAAAHVRADVGGRPCTLDPQHKARKLYGINALHVWMCRELWDELMDAVVDEEIEEIAAAAAPELEDECGEDVPDPPGWRGLAW